MKRFLSLILAICMLSGVAVMAMSCGGDTTPCETHKDENKDGKCDACGETVETEPPVCNPCVDENGDDTCDVCGACIICTDTDGDNICDFCEKIVNEPVEITFTVKANGGEDLSEILPDTDIFVTVKQGKTEKFNGKLSTDGSVKVTLVPGDYTVEVLGLPDGWYCEGSSARYSISAEKTSYTLVAVDNNPDGSVEKPFFLATEKITERFAPGETLHYATKGMKKYLRILNPNAMVTYNGFEFTPDANGLIRIPIEPEISSNGQIDTNTYTYFTVTNTSSSENEILAEFEVQPGSSEDPFEIDVNVTEQINVSKDNTVYYKWISDINGYLVLKAQSDTSYIMMHNVTSCEVTGFTDGKGELYIRVSAGDNVMVAVSSNTSGDDVEFAIVSYSANSQNPVDFDNDAYFRVGKSQSEYDKNKVYFRYDGADASEITINGEGISVALKDKDGNVYQPVSGNQGSDGTFTFILTVENGDVLEITCDEVMSAESMNNSVEVSIKF